MATYSELRALFSNDELRHKIEIAVIIAAEAIRSELATVPNHANRLTWAIEAFNQPAAVANKMMMAVLAGNAAATVAQITGATDAAIQTKVNAAVDLFAI